MKIDGAGGCFGNRIYEVSRQDAWKLAKECVLEMNLAVDKIDEKDFLITGKLEKSEKKNFLASLFQNSQKLFQTAVLTSDNPSMVQVIFDVHKKIPTAYQWGKSDKEVEDFYKRFEKKLEIMLRGVECPRCKTIVDRKVKFCPNCGAPMTGTGTDPQA